MKQSSSAVTEVEELVSKVIKFLNDYKWIIDAYVSDFFVKCLHEEVPSSWWSILSSLHPEELASLLHRETWKSSQVWPLSLLAFRSVVTKWTPPRENVQQSFHTLSWDKELEVLTSKALDASGCSQSVDNTYSIKDGQLKELEHCYRRHVKPKKQHEIIKLAELIKSLCQSCSCNHAVDVGAGQGHLARLLSFGHGIQVTTLEAVSCHTPKAQKYDREVLNDVRKRRKPLSADEEKLRKLDEVSHQLAEPSHVVALITPNMSTEDFLNTLHKKQACFNDNESFGRKHTHNCISSGSHILDAKRQQYEDSSVDAGESREYRSQVVGSNSVHIENHSDTMNGSYTYTDDRLNLSDHCDTQIHQTLTVEDHSSISTLDNLDPADGSGIHEQNSTVSDSCTHIQCYSSIMYESGCNLQQNGTDVQHTPSTKHGTDVQQTLSTADGTHVQQTLSTADVIHIQKSLNTKDKSGTHIEQDSIKATDACNKFVLTGLHACGDLTSTMLRVFVQCPQAIGLASVGCCYMKLSTESQDTSNENCGIYGYPMSNFVKSLPGHQLSYEAREMACHFIDCYHDRLKNNLPQLRSHVYRAALQEIIQQKAPNIQHGSIKVTVKHTEDLPFTQYAKMALKKLKLNEEISDEQLVVAESRLKHWRYVVAFYTLRLSLAPLVEMVLLLDRALYLAENGIPCKLLPLFAAQLSPRNFVLIAKK